jgi:hypothetical protein
MAKISKILFLRKMKPLQIVTSLAFAAQVCSGWQINWYSDLNCKNYIGSENGPYKGISDPECDNVRKGSNAKSFMAWMDSSNNLRVCDGGQRIWNEREFLFTCICSKTKVATQGKNQCITINNRNVGKCIEYH